MNPAAIQLAKGGPFAPTSWGAFGPHWLWVSPIEVGQVVVIGTATERELAQLITPVKGAPVQIGSTCEVLSPTAICEVTV